MNFDPEQERRQTDVLDLDRARALLIALDRSADLRVGEALPPFFHQIYFWEARLARALGRDGHPRVGGLIPDFGLPRRMWAGGDLRFHAPLWAGQPAEKVTRCESASQKTGRSGPLAFVVLRHEIWQDGTLCISERQDLVYREDPKPDAVPPSAPTARMDEEEAERRSFDSTLLFRYSALTFNGHRIHYDLDYAREVEGYAGLVVHGPLLAQCLMLMAEARAPVQSFAFRATAPAMHGEAVTLCRNGPDAWVRGADGRQCMLAQIT